MAGFSCLRGDVVMEEDRTEGWLAGDVFSEDLTGRLRGQLATG